MSLIKKLIFSMTIFIFLSSCGLNEEEDDSCPTSEDLSGNTSAIGVAVGRKLAQGFTLNGIVGATIHASNIAINMDSVNLTQVKMDVYSKQSGPHIVDPEGGTLLGSSIVTSGLGNSNNSIATNFSFTSPLPFTVGASYYFVITGTGGSFNVVYVDPQRVSSGDIYLYSSSSWGSPAGLDFASLSMAFTFSHCTGI